MLSTTITRWLQHDSKTTGIQPRREKLQPAGCVLTYPVTMAVCCLVAISPGRAQDGVLRGSPSSSVEACPVQGNSELSCPADAKGTPCGPASMAYALHLMGLPVRNDELGKLADDNGFTSIERLQTYARGLNLHCQALTISPRALSHLRNVAIVHLRMRDADVGEFDHYVVLAGATDNETVNAYDPVAVHGFRGPTPLHFIASKMSGHILVLSRFPLELSALEGKGIQSERARLIKMSLAGVSALFGLCLIGFAIVRRGSRTTSSVAKAIASFVFVVLVAGGCDTHSAAKHEALSYKETPHEEYIAAGQLSHGIPLSTYVHGNCLWEGGLVSRGAVLVHEFILRNPTSAPTTFRLGKTNCLCTSAEFLGSPTVSPRETVGLSLTMHADKPGKVLGIAVLYASGAKEPIQVGIGATVKDDTRVSERTIDFGYIWPTAPVETRFVNLTHHCETSKEFKITSCSTDISFIQAVAIEKPAEVVSEDLQKINYQLKVTADTRTAMPGPFGGTLVVVARRNDEDLKYRLGIEGTIQDWASVSPSKIVTIGPNLPKVLDTQLELASNVDSELLIRDVKGQSVDILNWRQIHSEGDKTVSLNLQLKTPKPGEKLKGRCQIIFDKPKDQMIELDVFIWSVVE